MLLQPRPPLEIIVLLSLITFIVAWSDDNMPAERPEYPPTLLHSALPPTSTPNSEFKLCNFSHGEWVVDPERPLYTGASCKMILDKDNCERNGRETRDYQKLRWQPFHCTHRRFSPLTFSQTMANKTIYVVGDSIGRQLSSTMRCLADLQGSGLENWEMEVPGKWPLKGFRHPLTHTFLTSTFSNTLLETQLKKGALKVQLGEVDSRWAVYTDVVDVIIFQCTKWWYNPDNEYYLDGKLMEIGSWEAYEIGLKTVVNYLRKVNFKGHVLMLSESPTHVKMPRRVAQRRTKCTTNRTMTPGEVESFLSYHAVIPQIFEIQEKIISGLPRYHFLDVTTMSINRPDAHLQIWRLYRNKEDCTHWCEAGVLDSWVEMIHNYFLSIFGESDTLS